MKYIIYDKIELGNNTHLDKGKEYEADDMESLLNELRKDKINLETIKVADKNTGFIIY